MGNHVKMSSAMRSRGDLNEKAHLEVKRPAKDNLQYVVLDLRWMAEIERLYESEERIRYSSLLSVTRRTDYMRY